MIYNFSILFAILIVNQNQWIYWTTKIKSRLFEQPDLKVPQLWFKIVPWLRVKIVTWLRIKTIVWLRVKIVPPRRRVKIFPWMRVKIFSCLRVKIVPQSTEESQNCSMTETQYFFTNESQNCPMIESQNDSKIKNKKTNIIQGP